MLIRWSAAVVFVLMTLGGLLTWLGSPVTGHSLAGFAAFLVGLVGLLLADIAISLGQLVKSQIERQAENVAAVDRGEKVRRARAAQNKKLDRELADPNDWQDQHVEINPQRAEWAAQAGKRVN